MALREVAQLLPAAGADDEHAAIRGDRLGEQPAHEVVQDVQAGHRRVRSA